MNLRQRQIINRCVWFIDCVCNLSVKNMNVCRNDATRASELKFYNCGFCSNVDKFSIAKTIGNRAKSGTSVWPHQTLISHQRTRTWQFVEGSLPRCQNGGVELEDGEQKWLFIALEGRGGGV